MSSVHHYYVPQVELGKRKSSDTGSTKKSKKQASIQEPAVIAYQPGQVVAMCCEKYKEYKPQIAKIDKVNGAAGNVNITWLDGTYDSNWKVWNTGGRIIKTQFPYTLF